jgi:hypothetical protein
MRKKKPAVAAARTRRLGPPIASSAGRWAAGLATPIRPASWSAMPPIHTATADITGRQPRDITGYRAPRLFPKPLAKAGSQVMIESAWVVHSVEPESAGSGR